MLKAFDHVNVLTANLDEMVVWYQDVLGLTSGFRPNFPFPGAWLYLGDQAVVHLVATQEAPQNLDPQIEHFAFAAEGFAAFIETLKARGQTYKLAEVPGIGVTQVNVYDPDGNHLHIDFTDA